MTLDDFSRLHRQRIDDCLSAQLESLPAMAPRLRDAMRYGLLRVRNTAKIEPLRM